MRGKKLYNRKDIGEYFRNNELVSAYELRLKCKLKDSTAKNIIKMCLKRGWIFRYGYFKTPSQKNKVVIYQVIDKENIMRTWVDLAIEEWTKLKQEKLSMTQITESNTESNTETKTKTNSHCTPSASLITIKKSPSAPEPSGELDSVNLKEQKLSVTQLPDSTELKKLPESSGALLTGETELRHQIELKTQQVQASEELAHINWKVRNNRKLSEEEIDRAFQLAKLLSK